MSRRLAKVLHVAVDFGLPTVSYYLLRALGISVYAALLLGALVSAVIAAVPLLRSRRKLDGLAVYWTAMMVGAVGVSLISGSTRFLLAREALLNGITGIWFIVSIWARRPLAYLFSQPMIEGRMRWPDGWDELWERSARFRRMWRVSSAIWVTGLLVDAALRIVMAYSLPPDSVPALGTALYIATSVVLIAITNVYYFQSGVYDRHSAMYQTPTDSPKKVDASSRS
jgi:TctA family transporter